MKILAVCGMGLGTGLLLRMNTEAALARIGVDDVQVEVADIGTARGMGATADIIVTSSELAEQLGPVKGRLVTIHNFIDKGEIERKLREALNRPAETEEG
jgi:ascorbate PTS system EIIB component